jgi:DNA mismatch repair protein MutS2
MDGPAVEQAESLEDWYLVPESILGYYRDNLETIASATRAAVLLQDAKIRRFEGLDDLRGLIDRLGRSDDAEENLLRKQLSELRGCVNDVAINANSELKRRIESSSVTVPGGDILQVLRRGEDAREIFEVQLQGIFQVILKEAKARAAALLDLKGPDVARMDDIFPSEIQYPLELNTRALQAFEQDLRIRIESRGLKSRRDPARAFADKKEMVRRLVGDLMEFDFTYAIGCFALSERMVLPEIVDRPCLGFSEGRNLFLENAEPVSYSLGLAGQIEHTERVAILSGVNSGGKTSLLDLISQIAILAHMGLPVPAKSCRCGLFQELYYFSKSRGTLSAGAFETAMRKFAVVENSRRKLVLADELEAITEPGASARIIACMLDELNRLGSVAVFVSHLAEDVSRLAKTPVRVDGIEAEGLDDRNNLVVRRTPKYNHLARSTPELILDRLVRTTKGQEREFYSRLLAKFR